MIKIKNRHKAIIGSAAERTLARWWCKLNSGYDLERFIEYEHDKLNRQRIYNFLVMRHIEEMIGEARCLREWNKQ